LIKALEIKFKNASLWQAPGWDMHHKLEIVDSFVPKAALVAHLASIESFLCYNLLIVSLVNSYQIFGYITLH